MTVLDDRPPVSNVTITPGARPRPPWLGGSEPYFLNDPRPWRPELTVRVEGEDVPWWFRHKIGDELSRLFGLAPGWDGFRAEAITLEAVQQVLAVLAVLVTTTGEFTPPPQLIPLLDGGIQVEWHVGGDDIEIEIDGAGEAYVLATRADGGVVADGEISPGRDDEIMTIVATFLNNLSKRLQAAH